MRVGLFPNRIGLNYSMAYTLNPDGTRATETQEQAQVSGSPIYTFTSWSYDAEDRLIGESLTNLTSGFTLPSAYITNGDFSGSMTWDGSGAYASSNLTEAQAGMGTGAVLFDPSLGIKYGGNGSDWVLVLDNQGQVATISYSLSYSGVFTADGVVKSSEFTSPAGFTLSGSPTGYTDTYSYDHGWEPGIGMFVRRRGYDRHHDCTVTTGTTS